MYCIVGLSVLPCSLSCIYDECVDSKMFGFCTELPCCIASLFMSSCYYISRTCTLMIEPQTRSIFKLTLADPKRSGTLASTKCPWSACIPHSTSSCVPPHPPLVQRKGAILTVSSHIGLRQPTTTGYCDNITCDKHEKTNYYQYSRGLQHSPI